MPTSIATDDGEATEELTELLAGVARLFRNEEAQLSEHASTATVDVAAVKSKMESARQQLDECLQVVMEQRQSAALAAQAAKSFYESLGRLLRADAGALRGRSGEFDGIDEPSQLRRRAEAREEEANDMAEFRELSQEADDVSALFQKLNEAIAETRSDCSEAKERAADLEKQLEEEEEEEGRQNGRNVPQIFGAQAGGSAEMRQRQEEEEEERRRQQEEEAAQRERDERRRREELDRRQQEDEEEEKRRRAEADKRWKPTIFHIDGGELDLPYGCAIRAPDGELAADEFRCRLLPMDEVEMDSIPATEEVVGNVVQFESVGLRQLPASMRNGRGHWVIMLPHCAQRMSSKETVVYMLRSGVWMECPSVETHVENLEHQARWVETRITEPSATVVPVNKLKTDRFSVGKSGIRFTSSVDARVSLTIPEDAIKINIDQTLEVQPIDSNTMANLRANHHKETAGLLTTSSIIDHTSLKKNALRTVTFSFPLPLNPATQKKSRPGTAAEPRLRGVAEPAGRPKTAAAAARGAHDDEEEQIVLVVSYGGRGSVWEVCEDAELEMESGKDTVSFRTARICNRRIVALRASPRFVVESAPRLCELIEKSLEEKTACFVLRQKSEDPCEVMALLVASSRLERAVKQLKEQGYDHEEQGSRDELKVRERQKFVLRFRGNIVATDDDPDEPADIPLVFNSQLRSNVRLIVTEKDRFAQRALDQYRGFLDFFTNVSRISKDAKKGSQPTVIVVEARVASLLIAIPKSEEDMRVKSPRATPFNFKGKDSVTMEYLRDLSEQVSDHWELLAEKLEISRKRCSVIKRNWDSPEEQAFDMLLTWVKMQQVSRKKAPQLFRALKASGFPLLAESLRDMEQQNQQSARSRRSVRYEDDSRQSV